MPTMKIEMTIPELQSFIALNKKDIYRTELELEWLDNGGYNNINKRRKLMKEDLRRFHKFQIAAKKALRKAYEDQRESVMIDLVNEALRLNRERAEHQNEFVANIIVC